MGRRNKLSTNCEKANRPDEKLPRSRATVKVCNFLSFRPEGSIYEGKSRRLSSCIFPKEDLMKLRSQPIEFLRPVRPRNFLKAKKMPSKLWRKLQTKLIHRREKRAANVDLPLSPKSPLFWKEPFPSFVFLSSLPRLPSDRCHGEHGTHDRMCRDKLFVHFLSGTMKKRRHLFCTDSLAS